jgi:hypothetical protein
VADSENFRTTHSATSHSTLDLIFRVAHLSEHTLLRRLVLDPASVYCAETFVLFRDVLFENYPTLDFQNNFGETVKLYP